MDSDAKTRVIELLRQHYDVSRVSGQSVFELDAKAQIYLRYSKDLGSKFFFGVGEKEFMARCGGNFFVLFVCGGAHDVIVIPAATLRELLRGAPVAHGQWKLNIFVTDGIFQLQVPTKGRFDVSQFRNHFDFSPPTVRRDYSPQAVGLAAGPPAAQPTEPTEEPRESLARRLTRSVRDSANPEQFEAALLRLFKELGLKGSLIGGPGDTDVLIEEPRKIVVDGKSTRAASVGHVNLTRIKQHKVAHSAEGMLVASVGFQPAVLRDAAVEGAGLITVETLIEMLRIHQVLPASPLRYADLLLTQGLISSETLLPLKHEVDEQRQWLQDSLFILENLDFQPRSLDEVKGRLDVKSQQLQRPALSPQRISEILETLRRQPFGIVDSADGHFSSRFYPEQAKLRLHAATLLSETQ